MIVLYALLLATAVSLLLFFEESTSARRAVSLLSGICLAAALLPLLPEEWVQGIPSGYGRANPRALLFLLLAYGIGYPLTTRLLYPLRNRIMEAFDRRHGKGC